MSWQYDLTIMVRVLTNDMATPQRYTDSYIEQVLVTAGILIDNEIDLPQSYTFDISGVTISPDPIATNDIMFQALAPLKSACILNTGDFQKATLQSIKVRDGDSAIDTSVSFKGYRDVLEYGACASYEKIKDDIQSGKADGKNAGDFGTAVFSPYREPNVRGVQDVVAFFDTFASTVLIPRMDR